MCMVAQNGRLIIIHLIEMNIISQLILNDDSALRFFMISNYVEIIKRIGERVIIRNHPGIDLLD